MTAMMRTYGQIRFDAKKSRWVIPELEPHVALRLKQLFPRVPKHSATPYHIEHGKDVAADLEWFMSRYPLLMGESDRTVLHNSAQSYFKDQAERERIFLPDFVPTERPGLLPGQSLRWYQKTFLDLAEKTRSLLLIDDVGLGKTYEGLALGLVPGTLPLVIVVQPHLQKQWEEKAREFINLRVHSVKGNKPYDLPPSDIYIFKYTQLSPWVDVLTQGWVKAIVFDEVQQLRTGTSSAKGQAADAVCQHVPYRVGMTATLLYNYGIEAFNIIDIIRPRALGTRADFLREWCTDDGQGKGIVKDPDALGTYLRECHLILRRTKADVGQEAKQTEPNLEWVPPNEKAIQDSEDLAEMLARNVFSSDFQSAGASARELDTRLREMTGVTKARAVAAYVRMVIESGQPVVLFGWHREVYRIWQEELGDLNPLWYTGSESPVQKERNKKAFINGESNLFIMSLRSGEGADGIQHRCSTVIFGELDWSPQIHVQCIGRLDRDGQEDEVFVIYVVTNYGSDPVIIDIQGLKSSQSRGVTDPGQKSDIKQADANRIKKLAAHYLKSRGKKVPERGAANDSLSIGEQVALL